MGQEIPNDAGYGHQRPSYKYDPYSSESAHAFFRYDAPPRPRAPVSAVDTHITATDFQVMMDGANHDSIIRDEAIQLWTRLAVRALVLRGNIAAITQPAAIIAEANELRRHRNLPPLPA